tara:strand:- start:1447 stop:1842 length:396 start_codon:yes stop_codon:yes gene_type:complete
MEFVQEKLDNFLSTLDQKLESVLSVNARLVKENIELRKKNSTQSYKTPSSVAPDTEYSTDGKKKVIMECIPDTSKFRFRGNGTFDAKEQIKTFGSASFDKPTRSWVLEPNKTIDYIRTELSKDFDFQYLEN